MLKNPVFGKAGLHSCRLELRKSFRHVNNVSDPACFFIHFPPESLFTSPESLFRIYRNALFTSPGIRREGDGCQFRGEKRTNDTHESKTDPDAKLYRKGKGQEAKLGYLGHVLMENRHGLIVDAMVTQADGTAERDAGLLNDPSEMAEKPAMGPAWTDQCGSRQGLRHARLRDHAPCHRACDRMSLRTSSDLAAARSTSARPGTTVIRSARESGP